MEFLGQIIFISILSFFGYLIYKRVKTINQNINLGKDLKLTPHPDRWKNLILIAFGQKKMFKKPFPAVMHLFIYVGFILINVEVLEIILDGILGQHRIFAPLLGDFYGFLISFFEILAFLVLFSCVVFLIRRNVINVPRFKKPEMKGWPAMDGNLILVVEVVLMIAILSMNATDLVLQDRGDGHYPITGDFLISGFMKPMYLSFSDNTLIVIERSAWWFHIVGIFGFAFYVTYSKHLHIFMAFPNTYFGRIQPKGEMHNMPEITNEVKSMLELPIDESVAEPNEEDTFGAKDVTDLSWKNIMDAYSCTECGRCTAECPANLTGKKLSPRKIMMDIRDRAEELGSIIKKGGKIEDSKKTLLGDYISHEEINACTNCNACVEACPVSINPLDIILQTRRYVAMEASGSPSSWNAMFNNIETNLAPWKFSAQDRFKWAEDVQ